MKPGAATGFGPTKSLQRKSFGQTVMHSERHSQSQLNRLAKAKFDSVVPLVGGHDRRREAEVAYLLRSDTPTMLQSDL